MQEATFEPEGWRNSGKIPLGVWTCSGRDVVLRVHLGFLVVDARQRVATMNFFTAPGDLQPQVDSAKGATESPVFLPDAAKPHERSFSNVSVQQKLKKSVKVTVLLSKPESPLEP